MTELSRLSVIVPVAAGDESWVGLVPDLARLPAGAEIVFCGPSMSPKAPALIASDLAGPLRVRWVTSPPGLAASLNEGARESTHPWVWFLLPHARFDDEALIALAGSLEARPQAVHYFGAPAFAPSLARGLCLPRELWEWLEGFAPDAGRADRRLAWRARELDIPLRWIGGRLGGEAAPWLESAWQGLRQGLGGVGRYARSRWLSR